MASTETDIQPETMMQIYRRTMLIHRNDTRFRSMIKAGALTFVYYTVRGQEVLSAAAMTALRDDDYLVTTYRGLHDHLAKGIPPRLVWAEFLGRETGACKGKGGPMHITHPETGVMVTTGIVGSGLPIANGLALASMLRGEDRVTLVSFGDGSTNIGAFHEAMNMAAVWKLPVIFLCQNNRYGEHTAYADSTGAKKIIDRAIGYGMPGVRVDGNDAAATYAVTKEAVERARAGEGPTLIEAMTYRMLGHTLAGTFEYVPQALIDEAADADPLPRLSQAMLELGFEQQALDAVVAAIERQIDDAVEFAMASAVPNDVEIRRDVLKEEIAA